MPGMKNNMILKKLPLFCALKSKQTCNVGHALMGSLLCFHALGWKRLCNVGRGISLDLEEFALVLRPRIKTNV